MAGLPLPVGYWGFGILSQLAPIAIIFFSGIVAIYVGTIVSVIAWISGSVSLRDERGTPEAREEPSRNEPETGVEADQHDEIKQTTAAQP